MWHSSLSLLIVFLVCILPRSVLIWRLNMLAFCVGDDFPIDRNQAEDNHVQPLVLPEILLVPLFFVRFWKYPNPSSTRRKRSNKAAFPCSLESIEWVRRGAQYCFVSALPRTKVKTRKVAVDCQGQGPRTPEVETLKKCKARHFSRRFEK